MRASQAGDAAAVLSLMTDDVIFMVPGREPFGKDAFRAACEQMKTMRHSGTSDIREIKILGDWAYIRNSIDVTIKPPNGDAMHRCGYSLSILPGASDAAGGRGGRRTGRHVLCVSQGARAQRQCLDAILSNVTRPAEEMIVVAVLAQGSAHHEIEIRLRKRLVPQREMLRTSAGT